MVKFCIMQRFLLLMVMSFMAMSNAMSQVTGGGKAIELQPLSESFEFWGGSKMSLLSREEIGEGYPCLSSDGLRLYYVSGNFSYVMVSERSSVVSSFSTSKRLDFEIPGLSSAWVNGDESELYVCLGMYGQVFMWRSIGSSSNYVKDSEIRLLDSNGVTSVAPGALMSVSLTADKSELYVYHQYLGSIGFSRKSDNVYIQSDLVERPAGFRLDAIQLSRDGLHLLVSGKDSTKSNSYKSMYSFSRGSVGEKFRASSFRIVKIGAIMGLHVFQGTMSGDYSSLVFTGNKDVYWKDNDLYMANGSGVNDIGEEDESVGNRAFPHPFNESFRVKVDGFMGGRARLLGIEGSVLAERELQSNDLEFDMVGYGSGIYIVELSNGNKRMMLKAVKR